MNLISVFFHPYYCNIVKGYIASGLRKECVIIDKIYTSNKNTAFNTILKVISVIATECTNCTLGGFNFILFWNFNGNHTEIDRYWQKNTFLLFAKCLKMYSFFAFAF
jgi:hypothetical protein